ncbi:hypothetical protein Q8A67_020654 [Cirrhinus molitorella]|uniref:Uncharacterized protein n=1 Tax=Cirrhinus molitorella TaxID=172907 RepID=A0AA88TD05_9TELE|nr:hypothetical protein Q8A67_020654 [Cirrhinus molitorella]
MGDEHVGRSRTPEPLLQVRGLQVNEPVGGGELDGYHAPASDTAVMAQWRERSPWSQNVAYLPPVPCPRHFRGGKRHQVDEFKGLSVKTP